jgi:inner membrane protein
MLIAHAPAGYITCRLLKPLADRHHVKWRQFLFWGIFGALAPDLDMFYFLFVDQRQHLHHSYPSHWPVLWAALLLLALPWSRWRPHLGLPLLVFALGGFIHMLLDTVVGYIEWLAPFDSSSYALFVIQPRYHPWWLNFVLHWTFGLELLLWVAAAWMWRRAPQGSSLGQ